MFVKVSNVLISYFGAAKSLGFSQMKTEIVFYLCVKLYYKKCSIQTKTSTTIWCYVEMTSVFCLFDKHKKV